MNKEKALEMLMEFLTKYGDSIHFHSLFIQELRQIILNEAKGTEKQFFNALVKQFTFIADPAIQIDAIGKNEKLSHVPPHFKKPIYSIHIHTKVLNVRLLVIINDYGKAIFTTRFSEKSGKKKTDYSTHISVAIDRYNRIMEGDNE